MLVIDLCQSRSIATSAAWGHGIKTQVLLDSWIAFTSHWLNKHSAIPTSKQDTWDCWGIFILISLVWALVFLSSGITRREPKMIKGFLSYCGTRTSYGAFMRFPAVSIWQGFFSGKRISCFSVVSGWNWCSSYNLGIWKKSLRSSCWISWWHSWTVHTKPSSKFLGEDKAPQHGGALWCTLMLSVIHVFAMGICNMYQL